MKTTKLFALCLLALMLIATLASCGVKDVPKETEAPNTVEKLISKDSLAEYTLVAPVAEGTSYDGAIATVYQALSEKYGISVKLGDDFLMGDEQPSGKEIIFGTAKRDFVLDEFLPYDSYHIYFAEENIVINAGSPEAIKDGAEYFVSLLGEGGFAMNKEGYLKETELPLGNLKINGKYINEYKIITKGGTYGAKYAAELLQKTLREQTGFELEITKGSADAAFCLESINSEDGMYHIDVEGNSVTLYGAGLSGAYTAVNALIEIIGDCEDVTLTSTSAPMLTLNNTKKKLDDGKLSIGYMGDSIMFAREADKSYTILITELFQAAYPNADIEMKNHSASGRHTTWGLYTMEEGLLSAGYDDLIFISLGTNDAPYGNDYAKTALNYQSMIEKIRKHNPETEIVFISHGRENEMKNIMSGTHVDFLKAMLDVANYYDIPVIDNIYTLFNLCKDNWSEMWSYYISDTVHPNTKGQELYANTIWKSLSVALENSDGSKYGECGMPELPLFENSKVNAKEYDWLLFAKDAVYGTGEEAGWGTDGVATRIGASVSFGFEGIGLEVGVQRNSENTYCVLIQIYDEQGELVLEQERDAGKCYEIFVTNELEYGKYTAKLTVTKPSKYSSESGNNIRILDIKVIK